MTTGRPYCFDRSIFCFLEHFYVFQPPIPYCHPPFPCSVVRCLRTATNAWSPQIWGSSILLELPVLPFPAPQPASLNSPIPTSTVHKQNVMLIHTAESPHGSEDILSIPTNLARLRHAEPDLTHRPLNLAGAIDPRGALCAPNLPVEIV